MRHLYFLPVAAFVAGCLSALVGHVIPSVF